MKTDIEIAQSSTMLPIAEVAAKLGVPEDALEYYGRKFSYADLIVQIKKTAAALRERVLLLEHRLRGADGDGRRLLEGRIRLLRAMGREARELAVLCERYYERGYCRNGKYTL